MRHSHERIFLYKGGRKGKGIGAWGIERGMKAGGARFARCGA